MRSYLQDLLDNLPGRHPEWQFKLLSPTWADAFEMRGEANLQAVACEGVPRSRILRIAYEQAVLPRVIAREGVDIWIGINNTLPLLAGCRCVMVAQSMQFFTHADAYGWGQRRYLQTIFPLSIRRADRIIALSEISKKDITEKFRIPEGRVAVIPHHLPQGVLRASMRETVPDAEIVRRVTGSEEPFLLTISALYPYKNHRRLIEAFGQLRDEFPRHRLLIGGSETPGVRYTDLREWAEAAGVGTRVLPVGRVDAADLPALYRAADLMVAPSLYETFGLTVLESMHLGCPVVTTQDSSMAEVGGDTVELVDPMDVGSIANGLRRVLGDAGHRAEMAARGKARAAEFSVEENYRQVSNVLTGLGRNPGDKN